MPILANAIDVLRCFSETRRELTVTMVAELQGLPKSNVSRLLRSMRDVGLLDPVEGAHGYRPGVRLLELSQVMRGVQSLVARANDAVRRICDEVGHTGYVSALAGTVMVGLSHHAGRNPLKVGVPLGQRLPVDACSTGRALLAEMSDEQVRSLLCGRLSCASEHSPTTFKDLFQRLARARECGYAESAEEAGKGIGELSVAVRNPHSGEALSLCIAYPNATFEAQERANVIRLLLRAKSDISRYVS